MNQRSCPDCEESGAPVSRWDLVRATGTNAVAASVALSGSRRSAREAAWVNGSDGASIKLDART